jgi:hypothetical protein
MKMIDYLDLSVLKFRPPIYIDLLYNFYILLILRYLDFVFVE